ncbi:MAG: GldG family protein [Elusimicrobia bacterium]|nr:GldG family protein [Elusimicrobiota bacterium]
MTNHTESRSRELYERLFSWAGITITAAIIIVLNVIFYFAYFRIDISRGRIYSVSRASKKLVASLPDPVLVKIYASKELPPQILAHKKYLADLVKEYKNQAGGKLKVNFIEIGENQEKKQEAMRNGIAPVRFDIIARDKYEQREGFLGIAMQFRDKIETIPYIHDISNLEYDLTSRIKSMTTPGKPELLFLNAYNSISADDFEPSLLEALNHRFQIKNIDFNTLLTLSTAPSQGLRPLLFLGPQEKISKKDLFALDQRLMTGNPVCLALDAKKTNLNTFFASNNDTGMVEFLDSIGIKVRTAIVMDRQSQPMQISARQGIFVVTNIVQYPPFVLSDDLNRDNPVTKDIASLVLPFSAPIEFSTAAESGLSFTVLAKSSKYSWAKDPSAPYVSINPFQQPEFSEKDLKGPFNLAILAAGKFKSAFAEPPKESPGNSRLVLVSTSKFIQKTQRMPSQNYAFFLNLIDWLSKDHDLISIRSKSAAFRPLKEISSPAKMLVKYLNVLFPSFAMFVIGLWRWQAVKKRNKKLRKQYQQY